MATYHNDFDCLENSEDEEINENAGGKEKDKKSGGNERDETLGGEEINENSDGENKGENDTKDLLEETKNHNLNVFFRDLLKKRVGFQISGREAKDIISSVDTLIETIVARVTSKVGWLPFSRVVKVGSMAELTSIQLPDEFDYLAVIETDGIEVEKVCEGRSGYAHIKVVDQQLRRKWGTWLRNGYLSGTFKYGYSSISTYFDTLGNAFMTEVEKVVKKSKDDDLIIVTETGIMRPETKGIIAKHGPAFTPQFIWKPYDTKGHNIIIKVDVTPAIEMNLTQDIVTAEDTFYHSFWAKLEKHGKYMLVPCNVRASCESGLCFRLTFTETEVELVRDLSELHRDCYKLLKYIFNGGYGYKYFPSYVWKTLVLKHDCLCKEENDLATCFYTLVASCLHYLFNRKTEERIEPSRILRLLFRGEKFRLNIPSIFINDHNILYSRDYKIPCEQFLFEIESMLKSLEKISKMDEPDDSDLNIVSGIGTGFVSFVKGLPSFNNDFAIDHCLECFASYFNGAIL